MTGMFPFCRKISWADVNEKSRRRKAAAGSKGVRRARGRNHADDVSCVLRNDFKRRSARPTAAGAGGPLDFAAAEYAAAATGQIPAAGGARAIFDGLHSIFFALPRRTGFLRTVQSLCRESG